MVEIWSPWALTQKNCCGLNLWTAASTVKLTNNFMNLIYSHNESRITLQRWSIIDQKKFRRFEQNFSCSMIGLHENVMTLFKFLFLIRLKEGIFFPARKKVTFFYTDKQLSQSFFYPDQKIKWSFPFKNPWNFLYGEIYLHSNNNTMK